MTRSWLITGCSSGFGHEIAKAALAAGDNVFATSRDASQLEALRQLGAVPITLDVNAPAAQIEAVVNDILKKTRAGSIDYLVNNAGYLLEGAVEEVR
jgi:NAD(P)-dependent dehydrogenase (short-subunit alcohol dehydrogenase family)